MCTCERIVVGMRHHGFGFNIGLTNFRIADACWAGADTSSVADVLRGPPEIHHDDRGARVLAELAHFRAVVRAAHVCKDAVTPLAYYDSLDWRRNQDMISTARRLPQTGLLAMSRGGRARAVTVQRVAVKPD
jgi:hypothetical protein